MRTIFACIRALSVSTSFAQDIENLHPPQIPEYNNEDGILDQNGYYDDDILNDDDDFIDPNSRLKTYNQKIVCKERNSYIKEYPFSEQDNRGLIDKKDDGLFDRKNDTNDPGFDNKGILDKKDDGLFDNQTSNDACDDDQGI